MGRTILTGVYICIYVACVNTWIYKLANGQLTLVQNRVSGYIISLFITICLFLDWKYPTDINSHNQFINLAFNCFIIDIIINIVNWTGIFGYDAPNMFITFNGLVFAVTSLVLYWGRRHGLFNE